MKGIAIVVGTGPEIIKMSPVVRACECSGAKWFTVHRAGLFLRYGPWCSWGAGGNRSGVRMKTADPRVG